MIMEEEIVVDTLEESAPRASREPHDFDAMLVGDIHGTLIDAARLAKYEFNNGFPNWELFRAVYAGEDIHLPRLKRWVHEFAIASSLDSGLRTSSYDPTMAGIAGLDALFILVHGGPMLPAELIAEDFGVHHSTYERIRNAVYARLRASLILYTLQLGAAYRQIIFYERKRGL